MASTSTALTTKKLTPRQRQWAQLVATGCYSDVQAYKLAYGCKQATAEKNAHRNRADEGVMREVSRLTAIVNESLAELVTAKSKKGRLAYIMLHGNPGESVRAIKELNAMEMRELALGGGEETEFSRLLLLIAERKRVLPSQNPEEIAYLDV